MPHSAVTQTNRLESVGSRDTAHITSHEWRWMIVVGCLLVLFAFLPLIWVALRGTPGWQFMGSLHNYWDGATYLAKMRIGADGGWAIQFLHTPEPHSGALIMLVYPLLGHLAGALGVPLLVMFHVARGAASLLMYVAIYQLGATVWMKVSTRRIFFLIASLGAGLGWLFGPLLGISEIPDLYIAEAFPIYSTYVNVHFPLTIACLAMLISLLITAFRPAAKADPKFDSGLWVAAVLSFMLSMLYPQSLVPLGGAMLLYFVYDVVKHRTFDLRTVRWLMAVGLPALPAAIYDLVIIGINPTMEAWNMQNQMLAPPLWTWIIGLGIPLLLALPALIRAVRRMEQDGDRIMLLWLVCMFIAIYLPTHVQRRFAAAMMLPIAYFATRAIQDVWLNFIRRRARRLFIVGVAGIAMTPLFMLFLPAVPAMIGDPNPPVFLDENYRIAYSWIDAHTTEDDVVLAAPTSSLWLPGWAGARVVYAHQYETLDADAKHQAVLNWYNATDPAACDTLLDQYQIRYILRGPEEAELGNTVCFNSLRLAASIGTVSIYAGHTVNSINAP
ncbi:MAG: hypothetical protein U0670_01405 [Anaerolineae bacterium]